MLRSVSRSSTERGILVIQSAILCSANSISALLKYLLPFLAMISGNDGRKKSRMIPRPIAGMPSTI